MEHEWEQKRSNFNTNCYSPLDDWSIPATDEEGASNRNAFVGYTLRDGNVLPELRKLDDYGLWAGYSEEGMRATKQELMAGHGVVVGICARPMGLPGKDLSEVFINTKTWAHYTYERNTDNHSVCIVGWDDDYPASNFAHSLEDMDDAEAMELTTPPGDGAWIAKNSWRCADGTGTAVNDEGQVLGKTDWGVDGSGYFYISYYDHVICEPESFKFDNDLDGDVFYSHVYDYMPATYRFYELSDTNVISTANVFAAEADEQVVSVSTRSTKPNSRVTFALYRLNDDAKSPVDGKLVETHSYDMAYGGFHRFDLTDPFKVKAGQKFSVVSTVSTAEGDGTSKYEAAASCALNEEGAREGNYEFYAKAVVHKGESYLYRDNEWYDWAGYLEKNGEEGCVMDNFSIKAFALPWDSASYECVEGDGATWKQGGTEGLAFTYVEANEHGRPAFDRATVDGRELDPATCVVSDEDMVITLPAEYLAGLSAGEHTIVVHFGDGDPVTATFTVVAAEEPADDRPEEKGPEDESDPEPGAPTDADASRPGDAGRDGNADTGDVSGGGKRVSASTGKKASDGKSAGKSGLPRTDDPASSMPVALMLGAGCVLLAVGVSLGKQR